MIKQGGRYILTFFTVTLLLTCFLALSALIPKTAIRENIYKSAVYLCEGEMFGTLVEGVEPSRMDRYADSILLGIAYQYDNEHPLTSVMWSSYYHDKYENENVNLLTAVTQNREANQQYLRYWHGSIAIVRPLLLLFHIKQIYVLHGIVLLGLSVTLLWLLCRRKAYLQAGGVCLGLIMTGAWFVPFSLEYTWTYLLMLVMSIAAVLLLGQEKTRTFGLFFMVSGMLTAYMDFLTSETLTLTVPLLLLLGMKEWASKIQFAVRSILAWGMGYVGMWLMKWLMASVVLSENVMPYVSQHVQERIGGNIGLNEVQFLIRALWRNVSCLFPFAYGAAGVIAGVGLVLFGSYLGYVYRAKVIDRQSIRIYALIGVIPYIRYAVLRNHSYLHCFFTYRAQMATILSAVLILGLLTKGMPVVAKKKRK